MVSALAPAVDYEFGEIAGEPQPKLAPPGPYTADRV